MKPCDSISPDGDKCRMSQGHFGPHQIGEVYHPSKSWVTKCEDECTLHENIHDCGDKDCSRDYGAGYFLECIDCGYREELKENFTRVKGLDI